MLTFSFDTEWDSSLKMHLNTLFWEFSQQLLGFGLAYLFGWFGFGLFCFISKIEGLSIRNPRMELVSRMGKDRTRKDI